MRHSFVHAPWSAGRDGGLTIISCKKCKGNKTIKDKTRQEIYIERGMADRQRVVLAGAGDEEVAAVLAYPESMILILRSPVSPQGMSSLRSRPSLMTPSSGQGTTCSRPCISPSQKRSWASPASSSRT